MNRTESDTSIFESMRFVLVETNHPGNAGSAARAIKNMGFGQLVLVRPRFPDILEREDAIAYASGATDILKNALVTDSIDEALDGCQLAAAMTSRFRVFSPPVMTPREFAQSLPAKMPLKAAAVFGNERHGLENDVVERCHVLISIPANPAYPSLNLAQSVQLMAYECRMAFVSPFEAGENSQPVGFHGVPATVNEIDGMHRHLEQALIKMGFLDRDNPKKLMPRLKRLFSRSRLEKEEVNILRGIARQIERQADLLQKKGTD